MKKIFIKFSAPATLALAIALNSCNNAEEVKKQTEAQATQIQTAVDEQLNGLQEQVNAECAALVDSLANVQYSAFLETAKKEGKKVVKKPAPKKQEAKKPEPKKPETKADKMGGNTSTTNTAADKASKMGGTGSTTNTPNNKASKMGGTKP